jgi:pSer/pThr/pTyr-binding forkhead associated (FHA) protein
MRVFLDACGLSSALTLECDDPGLPATASVCHERGLPFVIIGRDPRSDFRLNDPLISRRHAYLQVIAGRLFCIDLESRSQIRWEGADEPATKRWLEQKQFIWLGRYRIRWRGRLGSNAQDAEILDPLSSGPLDRAETDQLPEGELQLPIRIGENPSSWTISSRLSLIGRSAECQLVLTDASISTYHASLIRTPLGIWVVDLLSREGVRVNGTRVRWAWLDDGDTLRVGRFTFVLRYRSAPDQISRQDVPLDAGAILTPSPVDSTEHSAGLPVEVVKPLVRQSSQASRLRTQVEPYSPFGGPLSAAPKRGDEWIPAPEFGAGPGAMWSQQIQFLEMLHSEMILMVRMFMTMHREHVSSIRDELDRVQQLTRELEILQTKLGDSSNTAKAEPPAAIERRDTGPRLSAKAPQEHRSGSTSARRGDRRERRKSPEATTNSGTESASSSRATDSKRRVEAESPQVSTVEFHAEITKRIAELQRERQGYWRRILSVMSVSVD